MAIATIDNPLGLEGYALWNWQHMDDESRAILLRQNGWDVAPDGLVNSMPSMPAPSLALAPGFTGSAFDWLNIVGDNLNPAGSPADIITQYRELGRRYGVPESIQQQVWDTSFKPGFSGTGYTPPTSTTAGAATPIVPPAYMDAPPPMPSMPAQPGASAGPTPGGQVGGSVTPNRTTLVDTSPGTAPTMGGANGTTPLTGAGGVSLYDPTITPQPGGFTPPAPGTPDPPRPANMNPGLINVAPGTGAVTPGSAADVPGGVVPGAQSYNVPGTEQPASGAGGTPPPFSAGPLGNAAATGAAPPALGGDVFGFEPPVNNLLPQLEPFYQSMFDELTGKTTSPLLAPILADYDRTALLNRDNQEQALAVRGIANSTLADDARTQTGIQQAGGRANLRLDTLQKELVPKLALASQVFGEGSQARTQAVNEFMQFLNAQFAQDQALSAEDARALTLMLNALGIGTTNPSQPNTQAVPTQPGVGGDVGNLWGNLLNSWLLGGGAG